MILNRLTMGFCSFLLVLFSYPASQANVLAANNDALCVLVGCLLFLPPTISAALSRSGQVWTIVLLLVGLGLQAWALHWVEAGSFIVLAISEGTLALRVWTIVYLTAWIAVIAGLLSQFTGRSQRP